VESGVEQAAVRAYRGGDEEAIVDVWNRALTPDGIAASVFIRQVLCDPNFDPEGLRVAVSGGTIAGFALAVRRLTPLWGDRLDREDGWITALGVDPGFQGRGIGSRLLDEAEAFLREAGAKRAAVSPYAPNYFWPGVDKEAYPAAYRLFLRRGYRPAYQAVAMDRSLVRYVVPEDARRVMAQRVAEGYVFHRLTPDRIFELITFAANHFNPDWGRAIREAIASGVPFDQFHVAVNPGGNIVGFAMHGGYGGVQERFGPFGVAESARGKGLGKVLLHLTLEEMRQKGLHGAWFLWTGEESPAGKLYLQAGFEITRTFDILVKEL